MATEEDRKLNYKLFALGSFASSVTNITLFAFVLAWVDLNGGISASPTEPHSIFMVLALILSGSLANSVFRLVTILRVKTVKYIHALIHVIAFVLGAYGVWLKFDEKEKSKRPHFQSLHSWYGLTVMILFVLQVFGGALIFLLPQTPWSVRIVARPYHKAIGIAILNLAGIAAITGMLILITFRFPKLLKKPKNPKYSPKTTEYIADMIPVLTFISCIITTFLILESRFKRKTPPMFQVEPEEEPTGEATATGNAVTSEEQRESKDNTSSKNDIQL